MLGRNGEGQLQIGFDTRVGLQIPPSPNNNLTTPSGEEVIENYRRIKAEVRQLVEEELERMMDTPALAEMIIQSK